MKYTLLLVLPFIICSPAISTEITETAVSTVKSSSTSSDFLAPADNSIKSSIEPTKTVKLTSLPTLLATQTADGTIHAATEVPVNGNGIFPTLTFKNEASCFSFTLFPLISSFYFFLLFFPFCLFSK